MRSAWPRRQWRRLAGLAALGLVLWQVIVVVSAGRDVTLATTRLAGGQAPPETWSDELDRLAGGLGVLRDRAVWLDPWTRALTYVPGVGSEVGAARGWLGAAADFAAAGSVLARLGDPDPGVRGGGTFGSLSTVARRLRDRPGEATRAAGLLRRGVASRRDWPAAVRVRGLVDADAILRAAEPGIAGLAEALPGLADALGANGPRRYLIVAQNNQELRPGGGFIGSFARVVLDQGVVSGFRFGDSYEIDGTRGQILFAPPAVREYFGLQQLVFRDANWSPDFPTDARLLQYAYEQHVGERLDGVIAIDLAAVQEILAATGPVDVPEFGERVGAENLIELANQYVSDAGPSASQHKELLGAVGESLMERLAPPDPAQLPAIARAIWRSLATKHLLVSSEAPDVAAGLERANVDGHQAAVGGSDYLMVVDANLGYNKVNDRVSRDVAYKVQDTGSGTATSDLSITYRFAAGPPARRLQLYQEYRSYVRVYVPERVRLTGAEGFVGPVDVAPEGDKLVIGGFLRVQPGETRVVRLCYYLLGGSFVPATYRLLVQKQAGARADTLSVRASDADGRSLLEWSGDLDRDTRLSVAEQPAGRLATALLRPTDGILASFVPWRRDLLTVDNH